VTKPRAWGAIIEGEPVDVDYWARALKQPSDPWIEIHGGIPVLRSDSLDGLLHPEEVRDHCVAHIERLNGAVALANEETKPVRFGHVVEVGPDGTFHRTIIVPAATYELRVSSVVLEITSFGPDGKPIQPPSLQSQVQVWAEYAEADELLDDALIYFGRGVDWFDIYKALECIIMRFGGPKKREEVFLSLGWAPTHEISRLKRTANAARHAKRRFEMPLHPMDIREAHALVGELLRRAFDEVAKNNKGE
jgi:hypothetical protein